MKASANPPQTPVILSIAGSDSCAGAGLQADIKTAAALGVHACSVVTTVTAQNSKGVTGIWPVPKEAIKAQLQAVFTDMPVTAIKIGLLGHLDAIDAVADILQQWRSIPVVLDPVLVASSGSALADSGALDALRSQLIPSATLLTPNLREAATLLNRNIAPNEDTMRSQVAELLTLGPRAVLLKGGHSQSHLATDFLATDSGITPFSGARVGTDHTHGSGCSMATAIACGFAKNLGLGQSVVEAKNYIQGAIEGAARLQLCASNGPVHTMHAYW